ncbi:hypothetical protein GGI05_006440, partial [Coemansia sp. RSA 2603]
AKDPKADQEALEQEIRHVERLASLLGRRPTGFKHRASKIQVNHDLDATLDGFFDVADEDDEDREDNERVGDILLNVGHRPAAGGPEAGEETEVAADPELKQKNIHAAPAGLIASHQAAEYDLAEDPFEKLETMKLQKSPAESVEYLPVDGYGSGDASGEEEEEEEEASASLVVSGKVAGNVDGVLGVDALDADDELVSSVGRSNTWKRQSMALIQERALLGPALPRIADASESESELSISDMSTSMSEHESDDDFEADKAVPDPVAAPVAEFAAPQKTPTSAGISNTAVLSEYMDILDYMDASGVPTLVTPRSAAQPASIPATAAPAVGSTTSNAAATADGNNKDDDDDGHVSSDLNRNSDSSSISLSEGSGMDSDSDSNYYAKLGTQQKFKIANVVDSNESFGTDSDSRQAPPETPVSMKKTVGSAAVQPAILAGRTTLRRNRRILGKMQSLRSDALGAKRGVAAPSFRTAQSASASVRTSVASEVS